MGLYFLKVKKEAFWNSKHSAKLSVSATSMALSGTGMLHRHRNRCLGWIYPAPARGKQALKPRSCFPSLARGIVPLSRTLPPTSEENWGVTALPWNPSDMVTSKPCAGSPRVGEHQSSSRAEDSHTEWAAVKAARRPSCLWKSGFKADPYFRDLSNP